jgi:hypothetical protein
MENHSNPHTEGVADASTISTKEKISINSEDARNMVRDFVLLKSFDVVSSGAYRKWVLKQKDLVQEWAVKMHEGYHTLICEVRNLAKYSIIAKSQGHADIATVCAKLSNCVECPHASIQGWNTCSITKVQCIGGVRVNTASDSTAIFVHARFLRFCLCFWYCSRFDHVLRRVVRGKYTKIYCDEFTLSEVSTMIHADTEIIDGMVQNFIRAITHIHETMYVLLGISKRGSETLSNFVI